MANKYRGEVQIALDGVEYTMRPTFEALTNIENRTGKGIMELIRAAVSTNLTLHEMVVIVHCSTEASGARIGMGTIGEALVRTGLATPMLPIVAFLKNALGGEDTEEGKDDSKDAVKD